MKEYFTHYFKMTVHLLIRGKVFIVLSICAFIGIGSLFGQGHKEPQLLCGVDEINNGNFANNGAIFYNTYIAQ